MDVTTSIASTVTRTAIQVVTNQQRPLLEIYANFRHRIGPHEVMDVQGYSKATPLLAEWLLCVRRSREERQCQK